ncbi:MAG: helix-hairpin-helix domain-containing protein [Candidatus Omnitrophica bacterium]|nr:helix-hairpin-helix domain-containing protein [Candidatus Omnitrophota bacterium]
MNRLRKWFFFLERRRASLLITACWVLMFLSILTVAVHKQAFMQMQLAQRLRSRGLTPWLARAAGEYARAEERYDTTEYDTLAELQREREKQFESGTFRYYLVDEERKLNINSATAEMLGRLPGISTAAAENILKSPGRPFAAVEQLSAVEGMGMREYEQCKEYVTVQGSGAVNINTAPAPVLQALGMDEELVGRILEYRAGLDGREGTADDRVFEDTQTILERLRAYTGLFAAQEAQLIALTSRRKLRVSAEVLTVEVRASILGGPEDRYQVTIDAQGIRQWRER